MKKLLGLLLIVCLGCSSKAPAAGSTTSGTTGSSGSGTSGGGGLGSACTQQAECSGSTACAQASCENGVCALVNQSEQTACDDSNPATLGDHCDGAGSCVSGTPGVVLGRAGARALYAMAEDSETVTRLTPIGDGKAERFAAVSNAHNVAVAYQDVGDQSELIRVALDGSTADSPVALSVPDATTVVSDVVLSSDHAWYLRTNPTDGIGRFWVASLVGDAAPTQVGPALIADDLLYVTASNRLVVAHRLNPNGSRVQSISPTGVVLTMAPDKAGTVHRLIRTSDDKVVYTANTQNSTSPDHTSARLYRADPAAASSEVMMSSNARWEILSSDAGGRFVLLKGGTVAEVCFMSTSVTSGGDGQLGLGACGADTSNDPTSQAQEQRGYLSPINFNHDSIEAVLSVAVIGQSAFRMLFKDTVTGARRLYGLGANQSVVDLTILNDSYADADYVGRVTNRASVSPSQILLFARNGTILSATLAGAVTNITDPNVWGDIVVGRRELSTVELEATMAPHPVVYRTATAGTQITRRSLPLKLALSETIYTQTDDGRVLFSSLRDEKWPARVVAANGSVQPVRELGPTTWADITVVGKNAAGELLVSGFSEGVARLSAVPLDGPEKPLALNAGDSFIPLALSPNGEDLVFMRRKDGSTEFEVALLRTDGTESAPIATTLTMAEPGGPESTVSFSPNGEFAALTLMPDRRYARWSGSQACTGELGRLAAPGATTLVALVSLRGASRGGSQTFAGAKAACGFFSGNNKLLIQKTVLETADLTVDSATTTAVPDGVSKSSCDGMAADGSVVFYFADSAAVCGAAGVNVFAYHPTDVQPRAISCVLPITGNRSLRALPGGVLVDPSSNSFSQARYFYAADGTSRDVAATSAILPISDRYFGVTPDQSTVVSWQTTAPTFTSVFTRPRVQNPTSQVVVNAESGSREPVGFGLGGSDIWVADQEQHTKARVRRFSLTGVLSQSITLPQTGFVDEVKVVDDVVIARHRGQTIRGVSPPGAFSRGGSSERTTRMYVLPSGDEPIDLDPSAPSHCARVPL